MSWKDKTEEVDESTLQQVTYFPQYQVGGGVIEPSASLEMDAETAAIYDKMKFDEGRSQFGQMAGSITASIASAKKSGKVLEDTFNVKGKEVKNFIPKPLRVITRAGLQGVSAWTGAVGGDLAQSAAQGDLKKHTWATALDSAFDAGNEEAMYELLGLGIGGIALKGVQFAAGKPYTNIQWIKDTIQKSNGKLTASQVVDGTILDTIEGLAEASWGGGHIRNQRVLNDRAINTYVNNFQNNFVEQAGRVGSDFELGRIYIRALESAQKQHKFVGGQMFEHLDEVINRMKITKFEGSPMLNSATQKVPANFATRGLVSTAGLKDWAARELNQIKGVEGVIDSWRYDYLQKIIKDDNLGNFIDFKSAQKLRSDWLEKLRNFENKTLDSYNTQDANVVKMMTRKIDDAMQTSATQMGGDFLAEYRSANKFWKAGADRLSNDIVSKIMSQNPERVGAQIFATGNVTEIRKARQALKSAEFFTKNSDKPIKFNETWQKMQQGYLVNTINRSRNVAGTELTQGAASRVGDDIAGGELNIPALKKLFTDPETAKTFQSAFTKNQRVSIKRFVSAIEAAQRRPQGAGTFMVTVGQAGLVIGAIGGGGFAAAGIPGAVAALTITPAMLSRALTNPKVTGWLAAGVKMKPTSKEYAPTLAKIANYFGLTPSID